MLTTHFIAWAVLTTEALCCSFQHVDDISKDVAETWSVLATCDLREQAGVWEADRTDPWLCRKDVCGFGRPG
jgi:hypothetical protein